ncbi:hypothetical protein JDW15_10280 [Aerococcaceae bacterium zg-ZJ1578]|uniref:hypothetical protein n=1 Tax=Aerococcaceae bacterium zg-252 TaxID=2796928 RepID=UPI001A29F8CD|nr:hypothetical protein [Aerococcaceae bacterium zg-1578]
MTMADFRNTKRVFYGGNEIIAVWYRGEKIWEKPEEYGADWEDLYKGTISYGGVIVTRYPRSYSRFVLIDASNNRKEFDMVGEDYQTITVGGFPFYLSRNSGGLSVRGNYRDRITIKGLRK